MNTLTTGALNRVLFLLTAVALASTLVACGKGESAVPPAKAASSASSGEKGEPKKEEGKDGGGLKLSAEDAQRAGIKVETLASLAFADSITVTATIRPNQDRIARVAPRVEGRIVSVSANLGDAVKAGQPLAVLDSLVIGEAQSALQQALSSQRVAQSDFKRAESLSAEEIIPQREFIRAKSELEKASAGLRSAQDRLRLLGGSAKAGTAASTFPLSTPLSGTVIQKAAIVGELGTPAAPLFTVADLSRVWIEANLTEDALSKVRVGAEATVKVAAYADELFKGRVTYVASLLDKDSRTVPARIEVDNKDGRLKPEMFATATIDTNGAKREALSVPDGAILLLQGQPTIFVAKGELFESRAIEPGEKLSGRTVIKSGVAAGEKVVTSGAYALKARLLKSQIGAE